MLLILPLLPFAAALFLLAFHRPIGRLIGWFVLPIPAIAFISYLTMVPQTAAGNTVSLQIPWVPLLGLSLSFQVSALSMLFLLLISFVGILVVIYSIFYLGKEERLTNFYIYLLLFMGAMFGVATADNLLLLYFFWELTSISSFLLIGFWFHKGPSTYGAQKAMLITVSVGFCMLAAFVLMGVTSGTFEISELLTNPEVIRDSGFYPIIALLIMIGAFTKSAQMPLHIWLPSAMEAPTPISCYLHSATMVKAGIFLLARFTPVLGSTALWNTTIATVGLVSLVCGSFMALRQTDLKALLAYSTISQLGLIICLLGIGTETAFLAALFHLVNHSAFKGSLFLMTGIVDHETGTRDMRLLYGLGKAMPFTAVIAFIGSLAMAGLPPFAGFLSKEMFFEAIYEAPSHGLSQLGGWAWLFPVLAVLGSLFTFVYSLSIFGKVFLGKELTDKTPKHPHEAPWGLLLPGLVLVSLNVILAFLPNVFGKAFIAPAVSFISGQAAADLHISFWHGVTPPLMMTAAVVAGGLFLYRHLGSLQPYLRDLKSPVSPGKFYDWALPALIRGAKRFTGSYMTGSLTLYMWIILFASLFFISIPIVQNRFWLNLISRDYARVEFIEVIMVAITAIAAICTANMKRRVHAILSLGIVGFMVSMFFVMHSAPDLAQTQLLVETVTLILYVLVLRQFPSGLSPKTPSSEGKKKARFYLSIFVGIGVTFLSFLTHANRQFEPVSSFYIENSQTLSGGANIVHVILVDFLGLNTLGEVTVLALAALGVFSLLNLYTDKKGQLRLDSPPFKEASTWDKPKRPLQQDNDIILLTMVKPIAFIILYVSIYLFISGHNAPGGGFIAGLMTSCAVLLLYITLGREFIKRVPIRVFTILPAGLLIAATCGMLGVTGGGEYLNHQVLHLELPLWGELELTTSLIFDFGAYLVVVGTVMAVIFNISKAQKE